MKFKNNILKHSFYSTFGVLIVVFIFAIGTCGVYLYMHQGQEKTVVENGNYQVKLFYYSGGLGTNHFIKIFSYENESNEKLLVSADIKDSADIKFINSHTVRLIILDYSYDSDMTKYWIQRDTLLFDLEQENETVTIK